MRKIDNQLIDRLTKGDLIPLLEYIKGDSELRLEVRQNGKAYIYYRKGKALEIGNTGYKVVEKYGDVPPSNLAESEPSKYFRLMKKSIDNWLDRNKERAEFDTQQNIAQQNQEKEDRYIILDMEYAFEQNQIEKKNREKRAVFDLLGIERETSKIIFFEVKTGLGAIKGKSGVDEHISDFKTYILGNNSTLFNSNLIKDFKNIIEDKIKLGILKDFNIPNNLGQQLPELVFVFHPENNSQITDFSNELQNRHKLIIVNTKNYKLK